MFVFNPQMLFINTSVLKMTWIVITSLIGMFSLATGFEGFMFKKMAPIWRLIAVAGGLMLIHPAILTDVFGIGIIAAVTVVQVLQTRTMPPRNPLPVKNTQV